jgi:hypothetical protein
LVKVKVKRVSPIAQAKLSIARILGASPFIPGYEVQPFQTSLIFLSLQLQVAAFGLFISKKYFDLNEEDD